MDTRRSPGRRIAAGSAAGVAAAIAYAIVQEIDLRLVGNNADDLLLIGGLVTSDRREARTIGLAGHLAAGAALGTLYVTFGRERLPGPAWLRGVFFATVENTALYPALLLEGHHPAVRSGELDRYWSATSFAQSVPRHLVFGVVLGGLADRLLPKHC